MKECPALLDYMNRIGAEQVNFRTWQVKEWKGKYYWERALIRVQPDGSIDADPGYEPSKDEAGRILATWREDMVPKSVRIKNFKPGVDFPKSTPGSTFYVFHDDEGYVTFVQELCVPKAYLPWSYWSDGQWRQMQPDNAIPFWMPYPRVKKAKLMIHEGAKAAKAAGELTKDHPWYDEFKHYEHWGLVGGSMSVRRADYKYLKAQMIRDVVYVCDNDWPGRHVLQNFSKQYGQHLVGVMFDKRFKESWDCADPLPEEFFHKGLYIGPPFDDFKQPATYATHQVPKPTGRSTITRIKDAFAEEWLHCVTPEVYVHRDWPSRLYGPKEFDNVVMPFSDSNDTHLLLQKDAAGKGYSLSYSPGQEPGPYVADNGHFINTYKKPSIKPLKGSAKPWLEFLQNLIPVEDDRNQVMRWVATLVARPEVRMLYSLLLISETQGVGKGTLAEKILRPLVGEGNASTPRERDIVDSNWNYWLAHKRLAIVHEIYAGSGWKAYNNLKTIITDKYIEVQKKFQAPYVIENWIHIIAMSNSMGAIKVAKDDRRWLIPRLTEVKPPQKYWVDFNHWLTFEGGLGIIMSWAKNFKGEYVGIGDEAPYTDLKKEIVEQGMGPAQQFVHDFLFRLKEKKGKVVTTDYDLMELVKNILYAGRDIPERITPLMLRKVGKEMHWCIGKKRWKIRGTTTLAHRLCSEQRNVDEDNSWDELKNEGFEIMDCSKLTAFYNSEKDM